MRFFTVFFKRIFIVLFYLSFLGSITFTYSQTTTTKKKKTANVSINPYNFTIKDTLNYIIFPKTNISIKPPLHFVVYEKINGFMHPGSSSTLQVKEITGTPYVMYTKALTSDYFENQGVKLVSTEEIKTRDNKSGSMFIVSFSVKGVDYERIMLFTGDYNKTVWINATYPTVVKFLLFEALKKSILTVRF